MRANERQMRHVSLMASSLASGLHTWEKFMVKRVMAWWAAAWLSLLLVGCGYNDFQRLDEQTRSAWSEVLNQFQRRADLVPNLVATVKGEANFEQQTLTRVIEARASATAMTVTPETLNDPQAMQRFQQAQAGLGSALSRLLVVSENYPNLKANQGFQDLRVQLEGTENRIAVARNDFNTSVQGYNSSALAFPMVIFAKMFGFAQKGFFQDLMLHKLLHQLNSNLLM
jgi:LemA protein